MTSPATIVLAAPASTTDQWSHLDIPAITAQLKDTGVYAPADQTPGLEKTVARGEKDGHHLHFVVLDESFVPFTVNRDIATELQSQVGGTVVVFTNNSIGTASDEFSRVDLEDATSESTTGAGPVQQGPTRSTARRPTATSTRRCGPSLIIGVVLKPPSPHVCCRFGASRGPEHH